MGENQAGGDGRHRDTCEEIAPLLPAGAMDALDPEEMALVSRHTGHCRACQLELARYRNTVDLLPLALPQVAPPATLRERVVGSLGPSEPLRFPGARTWAGAAAAVLLLVLLGGNVLLWDQLDDARSELRAIEERRESVTAAPSAWVQLTADDPSDESRGSLCVSGDGQVAWLIAYGLPPLPEDQVYQAWLVEDGHRVSAGMFRVDDEGRGFLSIWLDRPIHAFRSLGVTAEPAGGSPEPTGRRFLAGSF